LCGYDAINRKNGTMSNMRDLVDKIDQLSVAEKWRLVKHILETLEHAHVAPESRDEYQQRLRETYGVLSDNPMERPPQLPFEEREPLE
jgi:hypothetical protein